jgi:hypothetical protein
MHAVGFLRTNLDEYIEYRRGGNFNGEFRVFTMVDADLAEDAMREERMEIK